MFKDLVSDDGCEASGNPLTNFVSSFMKNDRSQQLANQVQMPEISDVSSLSEEDRTKIRNRSAVMIRQLYPGENEHVIEARMQELLQSTGLPPETAMGPTPTNVGGSSSSSSSTSIPDHSTNYNYNAEEPNFMNTHNGPYGGDGQVEDLASMLDSESDSSSAVSLFNAAYEQYQRHLQDMQEQIQTNQHYHFSADNPYLNHEDPLSLGMEAYGDGQLSIAIQAFEAQLQQNPSSETWLLLGRASADADMDTAAVKALEEAVACDPQNLDALLALGVSYTNEHASTRAGQCLRKWLECHPDYHDLVNEPSEHSQVSANEELLYMFQRAGQRNPQDVDIQTATGVLFSLLHHREEALEAFRNAVKLQPDDYGLWNKIGATCANAQQIDNALHAYQEALKLAPSYVRSWVNLGICMNMKGMHNDAAVCFLRALKLNKNATHTWYYLNISFAALGREDLVRKIQYKDPDMFADEFDI
eukprot:gb/GECH01001122.1/.p1 GENE.gb/GECH01001122.1/~~gb/GECH01001122.1/.p1  ORF type:complete len:473 (+),score=123.95 gb/GECH01001122.1/:1-1419(+)